MSDSSAQQRPCIPCQTSLFRAIPSAAEVASSLLQLDPGSLEQNCTLQPQDSNRHQASAGQREP